MGGGLSRGELPNVMHVTCDGSFRNLDLHAAYRQVRRGMEKEMSCLLCSAHFSHHG